MMEHKKEKPESGMVRGVREFFKTYNGCKNCIHRGDPFEMCEHGRNRSGRLICPGWKIDEGEHNAV